MTTPDTTLGDVVKAFAVAIEARGRLHFDRALLYLHQRNVERHAVLTKWLWNQLFKQLKRELAQPNRDMQLITELVSTMRKLVPPPPGRNDQQVGFGDQVAASFMDAYQRSRQRAAEEAVDEEEDVDSAGDPTDVGTKEDPDGFCSCRVSHEPEATCGIAAHRLAATQGRRTRSDDSVPLSHPYGGAFSKPYGIPPFN